jgi:hypothetical protein
VVEAAELVAGALPEPDTNLVIAALLHDTAANGRRVPAYLFEWSSARSHSAPD